MFKNVLGIGEQSQRELMLSWLLELDVYLYKNNSYTNNKCSGINGRFFCTVVDYNSPFRLHVDPGGYSAIKVIVQPKIIQSII